MSPMSGSQSVMKTGALLLTLMVSGLSNGYCQSPINEVIEKLRKESIEFNATVTNEEIINFLEFQYEIDPVMLQQFRDTKSDPEKLKTLLSDYRKSHNEAGIKLPTLKGLSEKQLSELRMVFEFKREEHFETIAAEERLESLSNDQLAAIVQEGAKLVENYDQLKQGSSERVVKMADSFPSYLDFLELHMIYLTDTDCQFFLQKGIGRGIGFLVSKEEGEWKLWSFNHYKSWDRQEVERQ